ncbi:MAG: hypothetical protein ABR597_03585, partial [Bacteroidales bacterium]
MINKGISSLLLRSKYLLFALLFSSAVFYSCGSGNADNQQQGSRVVLAEGYKAETEPYTIS